MLRGSFLLKNNMNEREQIELIETPRGMGERKLNGKCDIARYQRVHFERVGEPISEVDLRRYEVALMEGGGVAKIDARKIYKDLKTRYLNGDSSEKRRISEVVRTVPTVLEIPSSHPIAEFAPVRVEAEEHLVFSRRK